jgi:hypothetical protein
MAIGDRVPLDWARTQMNLATALRTVGRRRPDHNTLERCRSHMQVAWDEYRSDGHDDDGYFGDRNAQFDAAIAEPKKE